MFRSEKELLSALLNAKKLATKTNKNEKYDIEDYRDENGFINLTNVDDINVVKEIIDIVDNKNKKIESEKYDNENIDEGTDLLDFFKSYFNADNVNIYIKTPEGEIKLNSNKPGEFKFEGEKVEDVKPVYNECITSDLKEQEECDSIDKRSVLLKNAGGMFNAPFYNAALYICEMKYFNDCGIYSEDDVYPENIDTYVILPNIWNKIYNYEAEYYAEHMENGSEVYILNPETFELTKINETNDLWDYVMSIVQEQSI